MYPACLKVLDEEKHVYPGISGACMSGDVQVSVNMRMSWTQYPRRAVLIPVNAHSRALCSASGPCFPTGALQGVLQHLYTGGHCGRGEAVPAVVAGGAAEADDASTMDLELVHMWHDWARLADAVHEGADKAVMWGIMMAGTEKGWEGRAGRQRNGQQNLAWRNHPVS